MRLTSRGQFAIAAMVDLGMQPGRDPVKLSSISERQNISISYLEQLFSRLRQCGLVESARGPGGGYRLAKDMARISIAEIVLAVDEPPEAKPFGGVKNSRDERMLITHGLWAKLNERIFDYLASYSLKQLVEEHIALRGLGSSIIEINDAVRRREPELTTG